MYSLMILCPLVSSIVMLMWGSNLGVAGSNMFSCVIMGVCSGLSLLLYYDMVLAKSSLLIMYWPWIHFSLLNTNISFFVDSMSGGMIMVVNLVSFLVHVYSISYMKGDPHTPRFMSYLSLFTFFMLMLVSSQNFIQLFMGWEGVGLCSYLLMNFWYSSIQANKAAIKAMLVNSVGDAALMAAIVLMWFIYGTVNFSSVLSSQNMFWNSIMPILLLMGAMGKSAQIGLHMWLPDAMEGPTPVSALIHAATMVTAGVYLMISSSSIFESSPTALILTVLMGSMTALFAASMGLAQNDMKKMIAYSTCSQLGFMVLSCGMSYYSLALFHLMNHAFFKALLFLAAGSMIHSLLDEQDMSKMGSMSMIQPLSYVFMVMGSLSLAGFPFLSGYYSKDLLLELSSKEYFIMFGCWMGLTATLLTAFYSFKLIFSSFLSFQNSPKVYWKFSHESDWLLLMPLLMLSMGSMLSGFMLVNPTINNMVHPVLSLLGKLLPLMLSLMGIILGISLFLLTKMFWNVFLNSWLSHIYQFLSSAWDFDKVMSHTILFPLWSFGYMVTFKTFDTGMVEKLGPWGLSKQPMKFSSTMSAVQSGYMFNYALLMLLFCSLFIMFG